MGDNSGRNTKKVISIICVILAICIIGAGVVFWFSKNKTKGNGTVSNANSSLGIFANSQDSFYSFNADNVKKDEKTGITFVNNIIIAFFKPEASEEQINDAVNSIGGKIVGQMPSINQYQIEVNSADYDNLLNMADSLEKYEYIESAFPDLAIEFSEETIPNDPWKALFSKNTWDESKPSGLNWWHEAINSPKAWEYNSKLSHISIGMVDTGIYAEHEDLDGVLSSLSSDSKINDHGTHVAGIIGAKADNGVGISGIVWDCDVNAYVLGTRLDGTNSGENIESLTYIMGAIKCLIENNSRIVNISMGVKKEALTDDEKANSYGTMYSKYLCEFLEADLDFLIVQAAGNNSRDSFYNGMFSSIDENNCTVSDSVTYDDIRNRIIVVGAAENKKNCRFALSDFSNFGDGIDICAPGSDIYSTVVKGYSKLSGTSMATPIVAGVSALVWSADPALTGPEVKAIVCDKHNTKYDVTSDEHGIYRLVNAQLAVECALRNRKIANGNEDTTNGENSGNKEKEEGNSLYVSYVNDVLIPNYGCIDSGKTFLASEDFDEYNNYYKFEENVIGILKYVIRDFNGDGEDELLVLRMDKPDAEYSIIFDLYGFDGTEISLLSEYEQNRIFKGDADNKYSVMLTQYEGKYYLIMDEDYYYSIIGDGGDEIVYIYGFMNDEITQIDDIAGMGGTYSCMGELNMIFSQKCRELGLNNSAACIAFVQEDDIECLYCISSEVLDWNGTDSTFEFFFDSEHVLPSKDDYKTNGSLVSIVNNDVFIDRYYNESMVVDDLLLISISNFICNNWEKGEYHITIDKDSFYQDSSVLTFQGDVLETGKKVTFEVTWDGDYSGILYIDGVEADPWLEIYGWDRGLYSY